MLQKGVYAYAYMGSWQNLMNKKKENCKKKKFFCSNVIIEKMPGVDWKLVKISMKILLNKKIQLTIIICSFEAIPFYRKMYLKSFATSLMTQSFLATELNGKHD